jgi:hypothetical protein
MVNFSEYDPSEAINYMKRHSSTCFSAEEMADYLYLKNGDHERTMAYNVMCNAVITNKDIHKHYKFNKYNFGLYFAFSSDPDEVDMKEKNTRYDGKSWEYEYIEFITQGGDFDDDFDMAKKVNGKYSTTEILIKQNRLDTLTRMMEKYDIGPMPCENSDVYGDSINYRKLFIISRTYDNNKKKEKEKGNGNGIMRTIFIMTPFSLLAGWLYIMYFV